MNLPSDIVVRCKEFGIDISRVKEVNSLDEWWEYVTTKGYGFQDGNHDILYGLPMRKEDTDNRYVYRYKDKNTYSTCRTAIKLDFYFLKSAGRKKWIVLNNIKEIFDWILPRHQMQAKSLR